MSDLLHFSLLGPLRVSRGGKELALGAQHPRLILALLLARAGRLVEISELIELLWGDEVPPTAVNMVHRYIGMLRRVLEPERPARSDGRWLLRDVGGYRLALAGSRFDLVEFRQHVSAARQLSEQGDERAALDEYTAGLALWQGRSAAGLGAMTDEHPDFVALERERVTAVRDAAEAALRCDTPDRMLPALRAAVAGHPLDEALQAQLVLALAASGNQSEAFAWYDSVRVRLADELGVDPGAELQAAHLAILQREDSPPGAPTPVPPAQLPSDLPVFAGRDDLIEDGLARLSGEHSAVPILAFDGMPGVGKTTAAIRLAHRLVPRFPDGQLYADLRGFDPDGRVADPADVLHSFLGALGVAQDAIPASLDGRAALYRSVTAGRRLLIVLDNARDVDQVRPLLPGTAPNAVLVTSRGRLGGLATAHGADLRSVDVLSEPEARACLTERIGTARAAAEPQAVRQIIERCGRLPLALAVVAARAAADTDRSLGEIAMELRSGADRLDALSDDGLDRDVRAVFGWSYRRLSDGAARMLLLLPLHPGADFTVEVAASLSGTPLTLTRSHFAELTRTGLLSRYRPRQYRLHDLVRAFADELGTGRLSTGDREDAWRRLENHYLHTTYAAVRFVRPGFADVDVPDVRDDVTALAFDDLDAAQAWFADEHLTVRAVVARAASQPDAGVCWKLALLAKDLYGAVNLWLEWATTATLAVEASTRAGDIEGMAQSHRSLAGACHYLGDRAATARHLKVAADLFEQLGDVIGRAEVLMNLGWVARSEGQNAEGIGLLREALAVFVAAGRSHQELNILSMLANLYLAEGDDSRSWECAVTAARMARERDDHYKRELALLAVSRLLSRRGDLVPALRIAQHYVDHYRGRRDPHHVAMNLIEVGAVLHDAGELTDAGHVWRSALAMSDDSILDPFVASWLSPDAQMSYRRAAEKD